MKILYHHRTLGDGAEGIHIKEMVGAFRSLGHEVLLTGPAKGANLGNNSKSSPLSAIKKIFQGPLYEILELGYNFYNYYTLKKIISTFKPDFIYDRYMTFNYSCVGFGLHHHIPVFLEVNAPLAYERDKEKDETLYFKTIAYSIEKRASQNTFKTIVVSTPLKDYLVSMGVPPKKIFVLPNGVNQTVFKPCAPSPYLKNKFGIINSDIVIGFVGILRPWHGIDLLIDAFAEVHQKFPNTKLLLVGDGPIRSDLEKKSQQSGLNDSLIITGRVPHEKVAEHVAMFDVAVSPKATFYASPMKIPEYMAQKKLVVAPDTENIKDLIVHNLTGLLFKEGSQYALAETIMEAIKDPDIARKIGENACKEVSKRLNWKESAKKITDLYLESFS